MAELNIFHYHPGNGPVQRIDGRVKLLLLILSIVTIFSTSVHGLIAVTLFLVTGAALIPLKPRGFGRELVVFAVLAFVILMSRPSLFLGAIAAWRFLMVVTAGMVFTASTGPEEIHSVLFTLLSPLPGIPHGRIAEHVSLTILFIPLLFDTAKEITEARKARLIGGSRNPLRRLTSLAVPLLEAMFMRIEEVALALESRCFDESVVRLSLDFRLRDLLIAVVSAIGAGLCILYG